MELAWAPTPLTHQLPGSKWGGPDTQLGWSWALKKTAKQYGAQACLPGSSTRGPQGLHRILQHFA